MGGDTDSPIGPKGSGNREEQAHFRTRFPSVPPREQRLPYAWMGRITTGVWLEGVPGRGDMLCRRNRRMLSLSISSSRAFTSRASSFSFSACRSCMDSYTRGYAHKTKGELRERKWREHVSFPSHARARPASERAPDPRLQRWADCTYTYTWSTSYG